eukprot:s4082_g7.t1
MPAPVVVDTGDGESGGDGDPSSASNVEDVTRDGQRDTANSSGRWTAEERELWRARWSSWNAWPPTSTTPSGGFDSVSRAAPFTSDPWQSQGDPWGVGTSRDDDRVGGSDKIAVPEFSGEDDKDGLVTRGYLRKVAAWQRMTRLRPNKQALALYNNLTGRAWRDAEELDLALLDSTNGVSVFTTWISEKYLDKEVVKEIRDFNQEYDRQVSRLKEIGCNLPDLCLAWLYLDKLRLDNSAELSLLSSTGNKYELNKLQDAAVIQDRMNRRLWEPRKFHEKDKKGSHHAHVTENQEVEESVDEDTSGDEEETFPESDAETQEAYVTYQNAKSKYQAMMKSRGTNQAANKDERIRQAKARSYCSACKKRGHWHRDPECPLNQNKTGKTSPSPAPQVSHVCEAFHAAVGGDQNELLAITDCACSRTVAGSAWIKRLREEALAKGHRFELVLQHEQFKFGGDELFLSKKAWCFWMCIKGKWFILKVSELDTDVPLLLSRPVLAQLGMKYDLVTNKASFDALGLFDIGLQTTSTGLPAVPIAANLGAAPLWPKGIAWETTEIFVPSDREAYMVRQVADPVVSPKKLFYPKKLDPLVINKLSAEQLCPEWFRGWWKDNEFLRDFWIEGDIYMDRIHVTPRRDLFDPRTLSLVMSKPVSVWNMRRAELLEALKDLRVDFKYEMTVPELRSLYMEARGPVGRQGLGLTKCSVEQLKERCIEEGIEIPAKATHGLLLRLLRQSMETSGDSEVTFGQYKHYLFREVPADYLEWAIKEWTQAEQCSPDLARLARWADRTNKGMVERSRGYLEVRPFL